MSNWFVEWIGPKKRGRITREVHHTGAWRGQIANGARLEVERVQTPLGGAVAWRWWEKRGRVVAGFGQSSTVAEALESAQRSIAHTRRERAEAEGIEG